MSTSIDEMNQQLHKEGFIYYRAAVKQMIKAFIKKCPKDILKEVLRSEKIITRDWSAKGEKYGEYKKT